MLIGAMVFMCRPHPAVQVPPSQDIGLATDPVRQRRSCQPGYVWCAGLLGGLLFWGSVLGRMACVLPCHGLIVWFTHAAGARYGRCVHRHSHLVMRGDPSPIPVISFWAKTITNQSTRRCEERDARRDEGAARGKGPRAAADARPAAAGHAEPARPGRRPGDLQRHDASAVQNKASPLFARTCSRSTTGQK